jgi:hypothetical protein
MLRPFKKEQPRAYTHNIAVDCTPQSGVSYWAEITKSIVFSPQRK